MTSLEDFELVEDDEEEKEKVLKITIASTLADLAGEEKFSDVYFIVGEGKEQRSIPAHSVVLAVNSDVFEAMLYPFPFDDEKEDKASSEIPEIVIKDVNPLAFRTMLYCLYSDKGDISASQLVDLLKVAKKFQLRRLGVVCDNFLQDGITVENVCILFSKAQHIEEVKSIAFSFIEDKATEVFVSDGFMNLSKDCVMQILASDQLNCQEINVFDACINWSIAECKRQNLEETPENKKKIVTDLLKYVRFPVMKIEDLSNNVSPSKMISKDQVLQLFTYLGTEKDKRSELKMDFNTEEREAVLKWIFHTKYKSTRIQLEKTLSATNRSQQYAYCIGNSKMTEGKYCWAVDLETFNDEYWLLFGVGCIKEYKDTNEDPDDLKMWGLCSKGNNYDKGKTEESEAPPDFSTGPFHLLLDCDEGTLDILNLSNEKISTIKNIPKKTAVTNLEGGGLVPYFNLKKCGITVTPMSSRKFGKKLNN